MNAVTGATGHIGNVLVRKLLAEGKTVRAIVPPGEDTHPLDGLDIEIVRGDLRDVDSLLSAFRGIEVIYHLAGIISILPGRRELLHQVNVEGTQNVVQACFKSAVSRMVYTSSIHAIKEPPHGTVITETQPFDPHSVLGDYAKSKANATLAVIDGIRKGLNAVIVCPTGVIGPYDYRISEMGHLIQDFLRRKIKACVDGAYDFVDVRDVAQGLMLAGEKGGTGESYILSGEQISVKGLFSLLETITGINAPKFQISCKLARIAGIIATPYYKLCKSKPLFTSYSIDVLASNSLVSSAKAKRELGYFTRSIRESLADSVSWFRDQTSRQYEIERMRNSLIPT